MDSYHTTMMRHNRKMIEYQYSDKSISDLSNRDSATELQYMDCRYDDERLSQHLPQPCKAYKRRGRPIANNAARERSRVKTLRTAFLDLQRTLPAVPPDTKLSKLDVLVLATTYIAHLMSALQDGNDMSQIFAANGCMHPVKKWPMRSRLYAGILSSTGPGLLRQHEPCHHDVESDVIVPPDWLHDSRNFH